MLNFEDKKIVNAFIHLLITKSSLFSQKDRDELNKLIDETPDDIKALAETIRKWLRENNNLDNSIEVMDKKTSFPLIKELFFLIVGSGGGAISLGDRKRSIPDYKPNKRVIKNAIQQSKDSYEKNQDTKKNNS